MHGFLNIDKPTGMTSHDVVARIRRLANQRRVGHAGTLDPAATGVLVVALGTATRLIEYVQDQTLKRYRATIQLGVTTTTDDADGQVLETRPVPLFDQAALEAVLMLFRGAIQQVPPMYSALHHDGQRLYDLARKGIAVDIPARTVLIRELTLLEWQPPMVTLDIVCGKGTYIRSLARDIGVALGCGAHLRVLRRTAVGTFLVQEAVALDRLRSGSTEPNDVAVLPLIPLSDVLLQPDIAVADWPRINLDEHAARSVRNGKAMQFADIGGTRARVYQPDGALLALVEFDGDVWQPTKVFDWT